MLVGAAEDSGKLADANAAKAKYDLARSAGFDTIRLTAMWSKGMTSPPAAELTALQNAAGAASQDGIRTIVVIHNINGSNTPTADADRSQFVQYAQAVVRALPSVKDFIVGNEPNINNYWLPQFNADGSDAVATAYEALLAQTYDAIKGIRLDARVFGGALSPHGADNPTGTRPTHSPTQFIKDLGAVYRASGRTAPIMDGFVMHVYSDSATLPPSMEHPNVSTITLADYGKLVALLGQAFDGTAQAGSTLPILYGELGTETAIPAGKVGAYTGSENQTTADEAMQGAYWRETLKVAYCQPNVIGVINFHVSDEPALTGWQSGPYYADNSPKSSFPAFRDASNAARAGTLTSCPDTTPPTVTLSTPSNGAVLRGQILLSATAADDVGVGKVMYLVNGVVVSTKFNPGAGFSWNSGASGTYTITAQAVDAARNVGSSAAVTITVDNTPPETTLTPPASATTDSPAFTFAAPESGATFQCSFDGAAYSACVSPMSYTALAAGQHTFSVAAADSLGNLDASPATYTWTAADTTPPDTTITAGPTGAVAVKDAAFSFGASEGGSFECSLDGTAWTACSSPATYSGLADGSHTLGVRGKDAAGNVDPTPASRTWSIDSTAPETTITVGPSGTVTTNSASFTFTATESATYECSLDNAAWATCSSPKSYSGLASGSHTFSVRARDVVGNMDASPAVRSWTVTAPGVANDMFAKAQTVTKGTSVKASNVGATKEPGEPAHAGNAGGRSIWFRWTATSNGTVTFSTAGSSFDTTLGVYRGTSVSALARVASNDDWNGLTSRVSFNATADVTYMIAVDGYNAASGSVTLATS
jgi:hypothetical protein